MSDAVRVVTATMSSERFGHGAILAALEEGTLMAALARLRRWFDEDPATS